MCHTPSVPANNTPHNSRGGSLPSWSKVRRGLRIFLVLTLIGLVFVIYRSSFAASLRHLAAFRWQYLVLLTGMMVFDWIAGGTRIYLFASKLQPGISYRGCVRACLSNIFLGGVTPSQTGGGVGQIYVLYKEGMPAFDAAVVSFLGGFLCSALFLPACGIAVTLLFDPMKVDFRLQYLVKGTSIALGLIVALAVIGLVDPAAMQRGMRRLIGWFPPLRKWLERRGAVEGLMNLVERYHHMMKYFLARGKLRFAAGFVLTAMVYFNKFIIAWVVLRGLGVVASFWEVIYAQIVLILIFYFAPSPGASGVAEVTTAEVMKNIIPAGYGGAFVLLWRMFTLLIGVAVGALVTIRALYRKRHDGGGWVIDYRAESGKR
jgi:uncharacterized protein (TIRG00374 family)